jgi:antitoxin CptB
MKPQPPATDDLAAQRRRLRWRARRGLLENDLMLTRYLDRYESSLSNEQVIGLDELLDLTDNDLMDLLLARPNNLEVSSAAQKVVSVIRDLAPAAQVHFVAEPQK